MYSYQVDPISGQADKGEIEIVTSPTDLATLYTLRRSFPKSLEDHSELGKVFEDEYIIVIRDPVRFPNGTLGTYLRIIEKVTSPGVIILPVRGNDIFLIRAFRHATRSWEIELPRGNGHPGMSEDEAVASELWEETGLRPLDIKPLGRINPNSAILASTVQAFLVNVADGEPRVQGEDTEAISDVLTVSTGEINNMIREGSIRDAFTISTLYLAFAHNCFRIVD